MVAENLTVCDSSPVTEDSTNKNCFNYFSYGSNLLKERIHVQIKGAVFISNGVLYNYELAFFDGSKRWQGALASIEQKEGSNVWGCIWRVPDSFAQELDKQECGYHRLQVNIQLHGNSQSANNDTTLTCRTYQYSNKYRILSNPSPHYKRVIISGAIEHSLPPEYTEWLRKIHTNEYRGRVELDLKAIKDLNDECEDIGQPEERVFGREIEPVNKNTM